MVLTERWVAPASRHRSAWSTSVSMPPSRQRHAALHAEGRGVAPGISCGLLDDRAGLVESVARRHLREPSVGQPSGPPVGRRRLGADPDRDRLLHGQRRQSRRRSRARTRRRWVTVCSVHKPAQQRRSARTSAGRGWRSPCPAPRTRRRSSPGRRPAGTVRRQQVDLGRLLGDQCGLALREDDDAGDELERGESGEVAEEHERLVERRVHVIGAVPALCTAGSAPTTWS